MLCPLTIDGLNATQPDSQSNSAKVQFVSLIQAVQWLRSMFLVTEYLSQCCEFETLLSDSLKVLFIYLLLCFRTSDCGEPPDNGSRSRFRITEIQKIFHHNFFRLLAINHIKKKKKFRKNVECNLKKKTVHTNSAARV